MDETLVFLRPSSAAGVKTAVALLLLGLLAFSTRFCFVSAEVVVVIHRSRLSEEKGGPSGSTSARSGGGGGSSSTSSDTSRLEVVACTPHGTTVSFIIREFGQVRSERSTLTPGESASFEIAQGNMNDWTCIAKFELQNSTTRYFKEFPLWGPHGPKCSSCRWIFRDYQSGIFLDSHDGRGPVHVLDWDVDVDVDTNQLFSSEGD